MKTILTTIARMMFISVFALLLISSALGQTDKQYQELAARLVRSASVKPGDAVMIAGGTHMVQLMEAVAIEVQKAGGFPNMILSSDKVSRSFYTEVPEKYLEIEPRYFGEWIKNTDVYIGLPQTVDNKAVIAGVPEERFAKVNKASDFFADAINSFPVRLVTIDFPTQQDATANGVDFSTYRQMLTDATNADYNAISEKGLKLRSMLMSAKQVRITNSAGTDLTFSPAAGRTVFLDDGVVTADEAKSKMFFERIASLPAGSLMFAPQETSANGRVAIPKDYCRYDPMNDINFEFKNGVVQNFKAGSNGACYRDTMKPYSGNKERFGNITIGLNPAMRVLEEGNAHYRPQNAAGMVWIGVGDNRIYGGSNADIGGFGFPITKATVMIDGKTVIKDGKLVL